jgi:hypothetical protein
MACAALALACSKGDDDDDTGTDGGGTGSGTTGDTGSGGDDGGTGTGGDGSGSDAGGTGTGVDCSALDEAACLETEGCGGLFGRPFEEVQGGVVPYCIGEETFLECVPHQGCGDAETVACDGDSAWWFPSTCIPTGFEVCDDPSNGAAEPCGGFD